MFLRRVFRYGHSRLDWTYQAPDSDEQAFLKLFDRDAADEPDRAQALALLQMADLGIDDVVVEDHEVRLPGAPAGSVPAFRDRRVRLVHRTAGGGVPLDFAVESEGTRTWFNLIGAVLAALKAGSLLLFDELDASLHPRLSAELIRLFHDPATNPKGAQLIFTSHDTSLLNHLNRDEVWLTEKDEGGHRLGALAGSGRKTASATTRSTSAGAMFDVEWPKNHPNLRERRCNSPRPDGDPDLADAPLALEDNPSSTMHEFLAADRALTPARCPRAGHDRLVR